jgi:hypothetical protein
LGIDVTLVETGRLPADQISSTAFALSSQFPIVLSEIEQTKARDSGFHRWLLSADEGRFSGHGTPVQEAWSTSQATLENSSGTGDLEASGSS